MGVGQRKPGKCHKSSRTVMRIATTLTEADVEDAALDWLKDLGWQTAHGPDIAPGAPNSERSEYRQVVLERWPRKPSLVPQTARNIRDEPER